MKLWDEKALAYMSKVGEAVVEQIVAANMNGRKVLAFSFFTATSEAL
jgi:hypothetical protein